MDSKTIKQNGKNGANKNGFNGKNGAAARNGSNGKATQPAQAENPEVAAVVRQFTADGSLPPEKIKAILEERAKALARVTTASTDETRQVLVFSLANERYGISTDYVREIQPLNNLSKVPCTPNFVVGVINIRGAIYSVIDIRQFFGVAKKEITPQTKVILVNAAGLEVGILADDVIGATNVPLSHIKSSLSAHAGVKEEYVEGVTKDMLIILNLENLLAEERIIVNEEVA